MKIDDKDIVNYLEGQEAAMEGFLRQLAAAESPSRDAAAQGAVFDILKMKLESVGLTHWFMPGKNSGGFLTAKPQKRNKNLPIQLLIGHCDTVWEVGTLQQMPIEKKDGQLKGPGVFDMKAGLTQIVFALQTIQDLALPLQVTPYCLINSDEEIGSRESTPAIRRLAKIADRAYILEPPLGLEGRLKTARKGLGRFTLTVKGKAAHAGLNPDEGVSAILELSHQIQQLFSFNDLQKGITVNVGMIEGGQSPNVIAALSRAIVDVRVPNLQGAEDVTKKICSLQAIHPEVELEIEGGFGRLPMEKTARNQRLWKLAKKAAAHMDLFLEDAAAGGGSDANTTSLFTATLDGLGTTGDGAHASHEFIFLDKLRERTALLVLLLLLPPVKI